MRKQNQEFQDNLKSDDKQQNQSSKKTGTKDSLHQLAFSENSSPSKKQPENKTKVDQEIQQIADGVQINMSIDLKLLEKKTAKVVMNDQLNQELSTNGGAHLTVFNFNFNKEDSDDEGDNQKKDKHK